MSLTQNAIDFFNERSHFAIQTLHDNLIMYLTQIGEVPQFVRDVRRKIIDENKFHDWYHNNEIHDFIMCISEGHSLPAHNDLLRDKNPDTYQHLRANWIVQSPEEGGHIFTKNSTYIPKLDDIYIVDSKKLHGVSEVVGKTPLILYSFGFIKREIGYV